MKTVIYSLFILFLVSSGEALAEDCSAKYADIDDDHPFKQTVEVSRSLSRELCLIAIGPNPDETIMTVAPGLLRQWKETVLRETRPLKQVGIDLTREVQLLHDEIANGAPFYSFHVDKGPPVTYDVSGQTLAVIEDNNVCRQAGFSLNCYDLLEQLEIALNTVNAASNELAVNRTLEKIGLYSKQWENYFENARSQTFLELSVNSWLYRDELKKDHFVPPPDYQMIVLHPSVVYEYIDDANDGEQGEAALLMEWVGINWWNLKVPLGIAAVSTYSDRADVHDIGHGLVIHVANNYSIGYSRHDDSDGIFVTFDLLKLFEDKKSNFIKFRDTARKYID